MKVQLPEYFSQLDSRWASMLLGNNTQPQYSIANDGCLITCLAMVSRYFGINVDPRSLNQALVSEKKPDGTNGFQVGSGLYIWGSLSLLYPTILEEKTDTPNPLTDEQMAQIRTALDAGFPVVVEIDYNPPTSSFQSHYVILVDYNINDENDFTIVDPLGGVNNTSFVHSLKDYLASTGWGSARKLINQFAIYQGPFQPVVDSSCLLTNTPTNKKTYEDLVHGSTQWDQTVAAYIPGSDPKNPTDPKATDFTEVQKVISAFKGQTTSATSQLQDMTTELAQAKQEVVNMQDRNSSLQNQLLEQKQLYLAQIAALKSTFPQVAQMSKQYEGTISAKQNVLDIAKEEAYALKKQLAGLTAGGVQQDLSFLQKLLQLFNKKK